MDYGLILIIAAYLGALQLATRTNASPLLCSFVAVGLPYVVTMITLWILVNAQSAAVLADLFSVTGVVTVVLQFVIGFIVFRKIQNEDSISSTVGWSIGGFVVILFLIPFVVGKII